MICDRCYKPLDEGAHGLYQCPLEARRATATIWADAIPGGIDIAHGLCNEDGTPRRYYSRSEIRQACAVKGLVPYHDVYAEDGNQRLTDAKHRDEWLRSPQALREKRWRDEARAEKYLKRDRDEAMRARG